MNELLLRYVEISEEENNTNTLMLKSAELTLQNRNQKLVGE